MFPKRCRENKREIKTKRKNWIQHCGYMICLEHNKSALIGRIQGQSFTSFTKPSRELGKFIFWTKMLLNKLALSWTIFKMRNINENSIILLVYTSNIKRLTLEVNKRYKLFQMIASKLINFWDNESLCRKHEDIKLLENRSG